MVIWVNDLHEWFTHAGQAWNPSSAERILAGGEPDEPPAETVAINPAEATLRRIIEVRRAKGWSVVTKYSMIEDILDEDMPNLTTEIDETTGGRATG